MDDCRHTHLVIVSDRAGRLRCRHCHLTIKADELTDGYCPECFESGGQKHDDFEEVLPAGQGDILYRCEDCGMMMSPYNA